jgi:hypothetical protein
MKTLLFNILLMMLLFSCKKEKVERFSVVYEVEFISTWSATSHPTDFPSDPHFSPFMATSHLSSASLFIEGLDASEGLINLAETGNTDQLDEELQVMINLGQSLDKVKGNRFDSPGTSGKAQIGMRAGYQNVSIVSMIAPSPDWFVAATTSLLDPVDGLWYDEVIANAVSYDVGSDSGNTFTSANQAISPIEAVSYINQGPLTEGQDTVVNMGYFKFTRIQ